ncbi:hypothetical protein BGX26_003734 [Mortierella sp. AD094]|nr:hypothetical protein BGX26_003734 [Mortierella sp. AD094]
MVYLSQVLVAVTALVLTANTVDASFGICLGMRRTSVKVVAGYYLWNQGGDNSRDYDSLAFLTSRPIKLSNNNWAVSYVFDNPDDIVKVTNSKYSFDPNIKLNEVCRGEGGEKKIFYTCYSNDASWCAQNSAGQRAQCREWIEMGTDSLSCSTIKQNTNIIYSTPASPPSSSEAKQFNKYMAKT